ncbi:hypothetical protein M0R45_030971 [Rubus argutus]|uniref:Uncharacterized protein n=1 Tax=Rubus argutus TaxID=59490 RepID=A0AAW1WCI5_RUBAR
MPGVMVIEFRISRGCTYAFPENNTSGSDDEENSCTTVEENKAFWEEQHQLLQATLRRSSSIESKIRQATKEALREINSSTSMYCVCSRPVAAGDCRSCLRREICNRLISLGYNCAICKSKWRSSANTPSGEHSYLEVIDNSSRKRGEIRVVIEVNFRAEFEMARGGQDYNRLISCLPEGVCWESGEETRRVDQNCVQRSQNMYEGEENAFGTLEEAQVHASQVVWNSRPAINPLDHYRPSKLARRRRLCLPCVPRQFRFSELARASPYL